MSVIYFGEWNRGGHTLVPGGTSDLVSREVGSLVVEAVGTVGKVDTCKAGAGSGRHHGGACPPCLGAVADDFHDSVVASTLIFVEVY